MRGASLVRLVLAGATLTMLAACAEDLARVPPGMMLVPLPDGGLKGATAAQLPTYLGEPSLKRSEPPAEIWQYAARDCLLFLFLYREDAGMTVRHWDARDRRRRPYAPEVCARRIAAEAAAKAAAKGGV